MPDAPRTQAEIDAELRAAYSGADDLVEYVVVTRATPQRRGAIQVTRSFNGRVARGAVLPIWTLDNGQCGWGEVRRGYMLLTGSAPYFYGLHAGMGAAELAEFVRLGLIPAP